MNSLSRTAIQAGIQGLVNIRHTGSDDWALVQEHKAVMRKYLNAALAEIGSTATDFVHVDPDQYLTNVRAAFDPEAVTSMVQDVFTYAFYDAVCELKDRGFEPLASLKTLPSGAPVQE